MEEEGGKRDVAETAESTGRTEAPAAPQEMMCLLFGGAKCAALSPMIIALSAAKIIAIKIICNKIRDSSIKILT